MAFLGLTAGITSTFLVQEWFNVVEMDGIVVALVTLLTGALFFLFARLSGWPLVLNLVMVFLLVMIALVDGHERIIPNVLVLAVLALGLMDRFLLGGWVNGAGGFAVGALVFGLTYVISRGQVGEGDVKLAAAAGLFSGFVPTMAAILVACVTALVFGLVQLIRKKGQGIAFGPFLAIGFVLANLVLGRML